jgi:Fic family protein
MNPDRFRNSTAGELMRVGRGETVYWAYVPNPLPPALSWDGELVRVLSEADRALGELAGLSRHLVNPNLLIRPFIRREAVLSSRIEGTQADLNDLYAYEAGQSPPRESDVQEVLNYVHALEYGLKRLKTLPVSLRLIRELHARLMEGVRGEQATPGELRRSQNWIGPPGCTLREAVFVPPPSDEMHKALDAFEKYLHTNNSHPPLMRLALIHYQFEAIHPFIDGNGRIGRLLISLLLVHWNLLPLPLMYLSAYFERHRQNYYDLLLAVSERGTWKEWLLFFLNGVAEQSQDALHKAKQLQDLQIKWRKRLTRMRASFSLISLIDYLFTAPLITIPQAQTHLKVTYHSARLNISKLVTAGILKQVGENSYGKIYVAEAIMKIISSYE